VSGQLEELVFMILTGKFIKYIENLTTPTFTYSVEHRQHVPGA